MVSLWVHNYQRTSETLAVYEDSVYDNVLAPCMLVLASECEIIVIVAGHSIHILYMPTFNTYYVGIHQVIGIT